MPSAASYPGFCCETQMNGEIWLTDGTNAVKTCNLSLMRPPIPPFPNGCCGTGLEKLFEF